MTYGNNLSIYIGNLYVITNKKLCAILKMRAKYRETRLYSKFQIYQYWTKAWKSGHKIGQ